MTDTNSGFAAGVASGSAGDRLSAATSSQNVSSGSSLLSGDALALLGAGPVLSSLEDQLDKVEAAITQLQSFEVQDEAASPKASSRSYGEPARSNRQGRLARDSGKTPAEDAPEGASDPSLSSILAADAAIALSLLASRVPPPPAASPELHLSGPGSSGPAAGLSGLALPSAAAPSSPAAPALRDAAASAAEPAGPSSVDGSATATARAALDYTAPAAVRVAPVPPADAGSGPGAANFRFIHPDTPTAAAAAAALRGTYLDPASPSSAPEHPPKVDPGPPQPADSAASSNILFAVMNALCAPPVAPDTPAARDGSEASSSSASDARLVSGGDDGTVRVWRVGGGDGGASDAGNVLRGHKGPVYSIVVLPNGRIASGSADRTINIWRLSGGKLERSLKGHTHTVCALACFHDDRLISGSEDCTVRVWNSDPGACLVTLAGHTNTVTGVASVTDWVIVSSSGDATLRVWNLHTSSCIQVLRNHTGLVRSVIEVTSKSHRWLVSGAADRTVKVWKRETSSADAADAVWAFFEALGSGGAAADPAGGKLSTTDSWTCVNTHSHPSPVQGLAALGSDSFLTVSDSTVRVWRLEESQCAREIDVGSSKSAVTACPKEGWAAFGSPTGQIEVWDHLTPGTGSPLLARTLEGHQGPVRALEYVLADWRTRVRTACYF